MIGINDLTGGTSPAAVVASIEEALLYMKEAKPELEVVLLSVNHCPARANIKASISETNELMRDLVAQYTWMSYAEVEYAFCDNGVDSDAYWFTDGLHPTANGYVQKIVPAIKNALDGVGQPEMSDELLQELLAKAKALKAIELYDYREASYRSAEWATAKPHYEAAMALIEACESLEAVEELDLSSYITSLKAIKRNTEYVYADMVGNNGCVVWETATFKNALDSSVNGVYNVEHDGHRVVDNTYYSDMSFTFCLSDLVNEVGTTGILFRAKQLAGLGIEGYMINIVTEPNYIQIWYFNDSFGSATMFKNMTYIGGWVFPGEVENTLFRAVIEGNMCYIYTEADFRAKGKDSYGCSADLTHKGAFTPWAEGGIGILAWDSGNNAKCTLTIDNVSGKITKEPVPAIDKTQEIVTALKGSESIHSFNPANITGGDNGLFSGKEFGFKLYTALECANSTLTVTPSNANGNVSVAGYFVRCKKNATNDGIDGYLVNFVSNATEQYVQIFYLQNCYNTDGSSLICDYIGGWVFNGQVLGTTFEVTVEGNYITVAANGSSVSVALDGSSVGKSYTVHQNGGFGLISWQEGLTIDLTINKILVR